MKKLFSMLIFLSIVSLTGAKEFNEIPIPKGVKTEYDKLENQTTFTTSPSAFIKYCQIGAIAKAHLNIDLVVSDKDMSIFIINEWVNVSWIFTEKSKLFIDNGDDNIKSIELDWLANTRQVFNSERVIERGIIDDKIIIPFLKENLNYDSKVTIRYMGEGHKDKKLHKKDIQKLIDMIEFYEELKSTL